MYKKCIFVQKLYAKPKCAKSERKGTKMAKRQKITPKHAKMTWKCHFKKKMQKKAKQIDKKCENMGKSQKNAELLSPSQSTSPAGNWVNVYWRRGCPQLWPCSAGRMCIFFALFLHSNFLKIFSCFFFAHLFIFPPLWEKITGAPPVHLAGYCKSILNSPMYMYTHNI